MKKILILLLIFTLGLIVFTGCGGVVSTEGEGEGEGEGEEEAKQVVLVEAFVTDACHNCAQVKPILEEIADEYDRDEMILVELVPWGSCSTADATQRYYWYSLDGVPKIFFNGTSVISGSSSSTYAAIKTRIQAHLTLTPKISIQASRTTEGTTSIITGTIKNVSSSTLSNLVINGMTFKKSGNFISAVTNIFDDEKISVSSLEPGASKNFTITLEGMNWDGFGLDGVIFVQSGSSMKNIYQSLLIK